MEVFLGDRWYVFDPSGTAIPMGMVRLAPRRDAAGVAFATIFGSVQSSAPKIRAWAVQDPARGFELPQHSSLALSTDFPDGHGAPRAPASQAAGGARGLGTHARTAGGRRLRRFPGGC
ncbi:hypothetical protein A11G_0113930, partial [Xanthomonas vasicola pv. musacearum NCPPB 4392]